MKRIILVRHGESEGNVDRSAHRRIADHAISLTDRGKRQAIQAGQALADFLETLKKDQPMLSSRALQTTGFDDSAYWKNGEHRTHPNHKWSGVPTGWYRKGPPLFRLWTSPYHRTRQTTYGLITGLASKNLEHRILDIREHVNLVEQQAGLFDGLQDNEYKAEYPRETAYYDKQVEFEGKFWAPCPMGESRFDVAQRVHQSFGTFHRDADRHGIENIIVVCHGVSLRAFVMMWCHKPFEWFEKEKNPQNCSIRLIEDGVDKGYVFDGFERRKEVEIPDEWCLNCDKSPETYEEGWGGISLCGHCDEATDCTKGLLQYEDEALTPNLLKLKNAIEG